MFAVSWTDGALDELADAFVQTDASGRSVIENAVTKLNAHLAAYGGNLGESRSGYRRITFESPCAIMFTAGDPDDLAGLVRVIHFWTF